MGVNVEGGGGWRHISDALRRVLSSLTICSDADQRKYQAFWSCPVDFPQYGDPMTEISHIWCLWVLSGERVGVNVEGGGGIFLTLCVEFCLV